MARKKKGDDWVGALLALGIGFLAVQLIKKLSETPQDTNKTCMVCGYSTNKWARMCPRCRNTFPI